MRNRRISFQTLAVLSTYLFLVQSSPAEPDQNLSRLDIEAANTMVSDFLDNHCVNCHGEIKPKGNFQVYDLIGKTFTKADGKRWFRVHEMTELGEMPPENKKKQPTDQERKDFMVALNAILKANKMARSEWELALPRYANRIDHNALFSGEHKGPAYTKSRIWRISGDIYQRLMKDFDLGFDFVVPMKKNDTGFHDYSGLYADEATILTMKTNAKRVATAMIKGQPLRLRRNRDPSTFKKGFTGPKQREIKEFLEIKGEPSREQMEKVFKFVFSFFTKLDPTDELTARWLDKVVEPNARVGGVEGGLHGTIVSILLSPEFLFRVELGEGERLPDGRQMLSSTELAFALSYTLHNHPVKTVLTAAQEGKLITREDAEREFRALYDNPKLLRGSTAVGHKGNVWQQSKDHRRGTYSRPKLVQFFQQYFGYTKAPDVFKDDLRHGGKHDPENLVKDADWTVLHILANDKNVLEELLTTDRFAVDEGRRKKKNKLKPGEENPPAVHSYQEAYNMTEAAATGRGKATLAMPEGQRAGMLTHPAWLVAHSTNFHTDPVRRGKWILGHLLGYSVPELPIAAQAQLPEWHDKTIRQRFSVVEDEACWRCHKKMNPLGNPFEAYDDFGRYRQKHFVGSNGCLVETEFETISRHNPDKNALTAKPKIPVDMTGELFGTGDPELDGPVKSPVELMLKLAKSERVRQVFIRHVFRYFMGRNETLLDSPTLIAMDKAYLESEGSFKETLVALVTSDSFLYRR
ncbi:MAG: DUF1588 domain-containing protein [Akkermansiaceae bacterium]